MFGEDYSDSGDVPLHPPKHGKGSKVVPEPVPGAPQRSVKEIIKALDEEQDLGSGSKGNCCARLFVPFVVAMMIIMIFAAIAYTSGTGSDEIPAPRVALIVMEGFSGTVFHTLMQSGVHLPNIQNMLTNQRGVWAECPTSTNPSCARSVIVEDEATGETKVSAAASAASIFSGVGPRLHGVTNSSLPNMAAYATTSKTYRSLAKRVVDAGLRATAMGSSHLLNSLDSVTGSCSRPGVLDMECGTSKESVLKNGIDEYTGNVNLDCLATTSCNAQRRQTRSPTNPQECSDGHAEAQFTRALDAIFGGLAYTTPGQTTAGQNTIADNLQDSLFVFQFDALAVRAGSASLPRFTYSADSTEYVAQAYLIDAMVGQVLAFVRDRARSQKENWLVVGVSDHGGHAKSYSDATGAVMEEPDTAIPFFVSTYTTNFKGYVAMAPMERPVSQLDVLPTVLTWLNVAPFDETTLAAVEKKNTTALTPEQEARLEEHKKFEGVAQGICGSGLVPFDCVS